jgi:CTP-dependent riboflavin kinase
MNTSEVYTGRVKTGLGLGAAEMSRPGALEKFERLCGLDLVPGTLNLRLAAPMDLARLKYVRFADIGWEFDPASQGIPFRGETGVYLRRVTVAGRLPACLLIFAWVTDVHRHAELVSPHHLRTSLGLADGDPVTFTLDEPAV